MWDQDPGNFGDGGGFTNSQGAGGRRNAKSRSDSVICFYIDMIHSMVNTMGEHLKIGETTVSLVKVVGLLRSKKKQAKSISYDIDDLTGEPIEAKIWTEDGEEPRPLMENTYVKAYGTIRVMEGKPYIQALNVEPIKEYIEYVNHQLEVIYQNFELEHPERLKKNQENAAIGDGGASNFRPQSTGMPASSSAYTSAAPAAMGDTTVYGLNTEQTKIYNILKSCEDSTKGVSVEEVSSKTRMNRDQVKNILEFLTAEGHAFTTIDDDHYTLVM